MKHITYILICIVLFSSCNTEKKRQEDRIHQLEQAINKAKESEIKVDTIFLGLRFGMSKKETNKHLDELIESNKLYLSDGGYYTYDFQTSLGTIITKIATNYQDGYLYQVTLKFINMGTISDPNLLMIQANKVYQEKADADGFDYHFTYDAIGNPQYIYIKDNLIVEFSSAVNGMMSYINAPITKLVDADIKSREKETETDL